MYSLEVTKMARKFVQYNGDTTPYPWCATSEYLVKDQVYEVVQEIDLHTQVNYVLYGLEGFVYPSNWFTPSKEENYKFCKVLHGTAHEKPIVGKRFTCYLYDGDNLLPVLTSTVKGLERLSGHMIRVYTQNSVYYITLV